MAATSKNNGDIAIWVEEVIDSCTTPLHCIGARNLIRLFERKLSNEGVDIDSQIYYTRHLRNRLDNFLYKSIEDKLNNQDITVGGV